MTSGSRSPPSALLVGIAPKTGTALLAYWLGALPGLDLGKLLADAPRRDGRRRARAGAAPVDLERGGEAIDGRVRAGDRAARHAWSGMSGASPRCRDVSGAPFAWCERQSLIMGWCS